MQREPDEIDRKMPEKQVRAEIERLLADPEMEDTEFRKNLDRLAQCWAFHGLTWYWGPELYRRNRLLFSTFILQHFGIWRFGAGFRSKPVRWKGAIGNRLDAWFLEADQAEDIPLVHRLWQWKNNGKGRDEAMRKRIVSRFSNAATPAERQLVLEKYGGYFLMDEPTACALYDLDSAMASKFLESRIPRGGWPEGKRKPWGKLLGLADAIGDTKFHDHVYRCRIPTAEWERDIEAACGRISDADELNVWLKQHHANGWGLKLGPGYLKILTLRGRDVLPYIFEHLRAMARGLFFDSSFKKLARLAEEREWWDLWTALIRIVGTNKEFSEAVAQQLEEPSEADALSRLGMLSGISRELNFGEWGFASIPSLEDKVAVQLYRKFPNLLRRPFKVNLQMSSFIRYPKLTQSVVDAGDEPMIDFVAGRAASQFPQKAKKGTKLEIDVLTEYFDGLKSDPGQFAERAAAALAQIPAFSIFDYRSLIKKNRLARMLFERSPAEFLNSKSAIGELVEAQEIHVMALAYRVLALDDPRAREAAAENLDILLGIPLRPLHRKTRLPAFGALLSAATNEENARRILVKAREAMDLPDKKYPKEQLVGLIGQLLHRWPDLRDPAEQPVIYRSA